MTLAQYYRQTQSIVNTINNSTPKQMITGYIGGIKLYLRSAVNVNSQIIEEALERTNTKRVETKRVAVAFEPSE
jgi:hypothetical protein